MTAHLCFATFAALAIGFWVGRSQPKPIPVQTAPRPAESPEAKLRLAAILSGQGNTAMITHKASDKRGITPARTTEPKFVIDLSITGQAAWRIDKAQSGSENGRHNALRCAKTWLIIGCYIRRDHQASCL